MRAIYRAAATQVWVAWGMCATVLLGPGCGADYHAQKVSPDSREGTTLTVGTVQKEIRKGMAASQVAEALGSPNIVTTDESGREVWIYDRFATEAAYSNSSGGLLVIVGGAGGGAAAGGGGGIFGSSGASSTTQRTLTVIIKFDESRQVRDFAYHSSKF
jgi:outer membrane protein assembly factor BamE (lipoprotein component of BamABCDE complex)